MPEDTPVQHIQRRQSCAVFWSKSNILKVYRTGWRLAIVPDENAPMSTAILGSRVAGRKAAARRRTPHGLTAGRRRGRGRREGAGGGWGGGMGGRGGGGRGSGWRDGGGRRRMGRACGWRERARLRRAASRYAKRD